MTWQARFAAARASRYIDADAGHQLTIRDKLIHKKMLHTLQRSWLRGPFSLLVQVLQATLWQ
jgi:hypothetical protein